MTQRAAATYPLLAHLTAGALEGRGPLGAEVLDALRCTRVHPLIARALDTVGVAGSAETPHPSVFDAPEATRAFLIGDLHGRWALAERALERTGIYKDGMFYGERGDVIVQLGDLLDADLTGSYTRASDPRGDALIKAHAQIIEAARANLAPATLRWWESAMVGRMPDAMLYRSRHDIAGAAHVLHTLERFDALRRAAQASGARVTTLLGNHETDLLSGRLHYYRGQKRLLLAMMGVGAIDAWLAALCQARDREAITAHLGDTPLLGLLHDAPVIARVGPALAMHGGPTVGWTEALVAAEVTDMDGLTRFIAARRPYSYDHHFYREGASIFAPNPNGDDFVRDTDLLAPWLRASGCGMLAVGHSPFIAFERGSWLDLRRADVATRVSTIERLGPAGAVLKLDTNLKRDTTCAIATLIRDGTIVVHTATTTTTLPTPVASPEAQRAAICAAVPLLRIVDGLREPVPDDLVELGVDGDAYMRLFEIQGRIDLGEGEDAHLEHTIGWLMRAGPSSLEPLLRWLAQLEQTSSLTPIDAHKQRVERLTHALAEDLMESVVDGVGALLLDPVAREVDGVRYRLVDVVVTRLHDLCDALGAPRPFVRATELVALRGAPSLLLRTFDPGGRVCDERSQPPERADTWDTLFESARRAHDAYHALPLPKHAPAPTRGPTPSAQTDPGEPVVAQPPDLESWARSALFEANPDIGLTRPQVTDAPTLWTPKTGALPGATRVRGLMTRERWLMLTDTVFIDPGLVTTAVAFDKGGHVVDRAPHGSALLAHLEPGEVTLHAHLKPAVIRHLTAGEPERLGTGVLVRGRAVPWTQGAFLFTTPSLIAAQDYRGLNPVYVRLEVGRDDLRGLLEDGLVAINAITSDAGSPLDRDDGPLGTPEAAIEVVGLGRDGVMALWGHRVR